MLPKLTELELGFKTSSAETYICSRKDLITEVSYGREIDYNVRLTNTELPIVSKKFLQRPLVWTLLQKSEWIWSLIYERPIPPVAIHKTDDTLEVIDGKQRMHTTGEYLRNEFPLIHGSDEYLFGDLPQEYQDRILWGRPVLGYLAYDLTDLQKLQWFRFINYAGTPQDQKHILQLEKLLNAEKSK